MKEIQLKMQNRNIYFSDVDFACGVKSQELFAANKT